MQKRDKQFERLVGSRVRRLRNAKNLTVRDVAERAFVTAAEIRSAEEGLLCSRQSLERPGVQNEIERVLTKEASEGGSERLIPVTLDDFVFRRWSPAKPDIAAAVKERVVCDFTDVHGSPDAWKRQIGQLL